MTDALLMTPAAALLADYAAAVRIDDVIPAQTKVSLIKIGPALGLLIDDRPV